MAELPLVLSSAVDYAMAEWGLTGTPPEDMFAHVVELDATDEESGSANYSQCLAIAFWVIGKHKDALQQLDTAAHIMSEEPSAEFSCWRYLEVTPDVFRQDCESIRRLIQGESTKPLFFADSGN